MKRRDFLGGAAALIPAVVSAQSSSLRDRVLGAWRILDAETVNVTSGASRPWLGRPRPYSGMIAYLPNGLMSVQIAAARPPARSGAGFEALSADEKIAYADTWYAYYGRFEIDARFSRPREHHHHLALSAIDHPAPRTRADAARTAPAGTNHGAQEPPQDQRSSEKCHTGATRHERRSCPRRRSRPGSH